MRRALMLIGLLALLSACGGGSQNAGGGSDADDDVDTPVTIHAAASRTIGVAPLGVFFNADIDLSNDAFHEWEYTWDFGDTASGTWVTTGGSRNTDKGPVAAHVFETPGDYTVTLTVTDSDGDETTEHFTIEVLDPDTVYAGTATTCVSDIDDFDGCPSGAARVITDDITGIQDHIAQGRRVLLRRGARWTTTAAVYHRNIDGPVTIGAYGDCQSPDKRGICRNAPQIDLTGDEEGGIFNLYNTNDWRITDIHITGETTRWGAIGGNTDLVAILLLRLQTEGFNVPMGNSHWDTDGHDQMMVVDCDLSDAKSNILYIGSERLAIMGNRLRNPAESHVLRVWQAYMGVIGHNTISGASLYTDAGRHAIKLHGPSQDVLANAGNGEEGLVHPSRFIMITDNILGSSGPWPVCVGPQDGLQDERLQDIIIEKNRFFSGYGELSSTPVQVSLSLWARDVTVRNNIFDGTGSSRYYTGIQITRRGLEPAPTGNRIYNNTFYKTENDGDYTSYNGVRIGASAVDTIVRNNVARFSSSGSVVALIDDDSPDLTADHNLLTDTNLWVDPDNTDFLLKDFSLLAGAPAIDAGTAVPVHDDLMGTSRPQGAANDLGAVEYY